MTEPTVEPPSPDVVVGEESSLPGVHRGGFSRLPTAPLDVGVTSVHEESALESAEVRPPRGVAGWALGFAIAGLVGSFFVGWAFPLGSAALVIAILALRQPWESRAVAVWALVLASTSILYSVGWLVFASLR